MPERRLDDAQLAAALGDLGTQIAWPTAPDVRVGVLARIQAEPRRTPWWRIAWSPRYGFAPAILTIALALLAVLVFSPEARATATDILRLRGVEIFRGPVPTPSPTPVRSPGAVTPPSPTIDPASLGQLVTLDQAKARAGFPLLVPSDPALGVPDAVYLRGVPGSTAVSFAYGARTGIPVSAQLGLSTLVTELGGGTIEEGFFGKLVGPDTTIERVVVDGEPGFWIEGTPHFFFYRVPGTSGSVRQEELRLAGNTLLWQHNGLLLRLEAQVDKATALRIAASVR